MAAAAGAAAAAVPFLLAPSAGDIDVLDLTSKEGKKLYYKAIEGIQTKFDGKSKSLTVFKSDVTRHATAYGWNNGNANSDVINIANDAGVVKNLISEYAQLTNERLTDWANANLIGAGNQLRRAQNNHMMSEFLLNSIENKADVVTRAHEYTVGGTVVAALLWKLLMSDAQVDTIATVSVTRKALGTAQLSQSLLATHSSNIKSFNTYVNELRDTLKNYGAVTEDLLDNLLEAYQVAQDKQFVQDVKDMRNDYLRGKLTVTVDQLMSEAETIYKVRVQNEEWGEQSEEQKQIVALQAEMVKLKDTKLELDIKKRPSGTKTTKKDGKGKGTNSTDKFAWKDVPPKANQPKDKTVDGKKYYFCPHHNNGAGKWVRHELSACRNIPSTEDSEQSASSNANQAHAATTSDEEGEVDEEEAAMAELDSDCE